MKKLVALLFVLSLLAMVVPVLAASAGDAPDRSGGTPDVRGSGDDVQLVNELLRIICESESVPDDKGAYIYDPVTGKCVLVIDF